LGSYRLPLGNGSAHASILALAEHLEELQCKRKHAKETSRKNDSTMNKKFFYKNSKSFLLMPIILP
jgi:hypothetical protein